MRTYFVLSLALAAGCNSTVTVTAEVADNPNSALSAIVTFRAPGASSARVVSSAGAERLVTAEVPVDASGQGRIAVLGLAPSTNYAHVVEATVAGGVAASDPVNATTGALPAKLASLSMAITPKSGEPEPGYYLVSGAGQAPFAVDETGAVRWYCDFGATTQETKMQYDGSFTTYVGDETGATASVGQYARYTPDGAQLSALSVASPDATETTPLPLYTDNHELLITREADGSERFHLFGVALRTLGDADDTPAAWHELVRQKSDGTVELRWKSWTDHVAADELETGGATADVDHSNALAIDPTDGNYVASFRNLDALIKIDYQTGAAIWQLGGTQNQFTIVSDPLNGFQGQHSLRILENGHLLIYDNGLGHTPPESRAAEYTIDPAAKTATLVWQFRHSPAIETAIVGSVERLQNGNTLVAFALVGLVDEVDPQGGVVWEGQVLNAGNPQMTYRVRRLPSLYQLQAP